MAKVEYDRENCIGAAGCVAAASKFWKLANDGKADLKGSKKNSKTGKYELELKKKEDVVLNKEAAEACPAKVIVVKS